MTKAKISYVVSRVEYFDSNDCKSVIISRHASCRAADNKAKRLAAREPGFFTVHLARG